MPSILARMIVLRLADGALLVLLPDGAALRVERDGTVSAPVNPLAANPHGQA